MRTSDNRRETRNHAKDNNNKDKQKIIAIVMAVILVCLIAAGIYILNSEGIIEVGFLNGSSNQAIVEYTPIPEDVQAPTIEPEITPSVTPEVTKQVFIPDIGDLKELPDPTTIRLTEDKMTVEIMSDSAIISWNEYAEASYYVLAIYNNKHEEIQKDILWSNITTWQVPDFRSGKAIVYVYKDNGDDGTDDDEVIDIFAYEVFPVDGEEISHTPAQNKYYLLVDKSSFAISVFTYDENGEYTVLLHTFPCGLGMSDRLTAVGVWEISSKGPWKLWSTGWYSPYYCRFTAGLYIHGAVYAKADFSTLSPTSYEKIGTNSTSGCIRTTVEGAEWIYYNCPAGTVIEIVEYSDLIVYPGKPAVDPDYPNWDPTDPNKPGNKS